MTIQPTLFENTDPGDLLPTDFYDSSRFRVICGVAENLYLIDAESIDLIITSPPYNLGTKTWSMGNRNKLVVNRSAATPRHNGVGYHDDMKFDDYVAWLSDVFEELYRVAKPTAHLFFNHKLRTIKGRLMHPMSWLDDSCYKWTVKQEVIWNRVSSHNKAMQLFEPVDERIYWLTKGSDPTLDINKSTVWTESEKLPSWHPAPFPLSLPMMIISQIARNKDKDYTILDPFAGSLTVLRAAYASGYQAIAVEKNIDFLDRALREMSVDRSIIEN